VLLSKKLFRAGVLLCIVGVALILPGANGQSGPRPLEFDVASIHVNPFSRGGWQTGSGTLRGSGNLVSLLMVAYSIDSADNIVGLPEWALSTYYDIQAKTPGSFSQEQTREMERNFLAQRFHLSAHWTTLNRAGYVLRRVAKSEKLPPAAKDDGSPPDGRGSISLTSTGMRVHRSTMNHVASALVLMLRQSVENQTGLAGGYEFELTFERPNLNAGADRGASDGGPSIFTALRSIGLELVSKKIDVKTLNVDSVARPSEN
jgi:uncharacterized protein (TIGR03435 family)